MLSSLGCYLSQKETFTSEIFVCRPFQSELVLLNMVARFVKIFSGLLGMRNDIFQLTLMTDLFLVNFAIIQPIEKTTWNFIWLNVTKFSRQKEIFEYLEFHWNTYFQIFWKIFSLWLQTLPIKMGPNLFGCPFCQSTHKRNWAMKRHILSHTGEKPFSCNYCPYSYSRKDKLKEHTVSKHSIPVKIECWFHWNRNTCLDIRFRLN